MKFTDIASHWAKSYIEKAVRMGKMIGKSETIFGPDDKYTRGEVAVMATRTPMTWGEVVKYASPSVARLEKGSQGTGFVISDQGHILTAGHVIGDKDYMSVRMFDGSTDIADVVVKKHPNYDIGILKLRNLRPPKLDIDDLDRVYQGEQVLGLGFPGGNWDVTYGFVERDLVGGSQSMFDVDTTWGSGNSGGPVLNQCGEVLGVIRYSNGEATNAVYLKKWIEENAK